MLVSRPSSKGQVTIPRNIREILGLQPGDLVSDEVHDGVVTLKRVESFDAAFHAALSETLDEWSMPQDEEAFRSS